MKGTTTMPSVVFLLVLFLAFSFTPSAQPAHAEEGGGKSGEKIPVELNGYIEARSGCRTQKDQYEKDISVMELRLQAELSSSYEWGDFKYKGDVWADGITKRGKYDTREMWFFARPVDFLDVKIGRQILTWGTGGLVFLNDLFPKDWQSFFIGRDAEYLKAPSDAVKLSLFTDHVNADLVYTPQFDPDRFITGEYVSYWNANPGRPAGRDTLLHSRKPDRWLRDYEVAVRLYRNIKNYELAVYGYRGFWKNPGGQTPSGAATFPRLNVYGASARGQIMRGIGNIELAYYQSVDDEDGRDPLANNSEMRYLLGYAQEIQRDLNVSLQYYVEQMLDYGRYRRNLTAGSARNHYRHVITLELTKLTMNQNLRLSLSGYYSPSDSDAYIRPNIHYKYTDHTALESGANIFLGKHSYTFFGQYENNTNIYAAIRYSF
jgi:hypothetical protein